MTKVERLEDALRQVIEWVQQLPSGIDKNANMEDSSPEDMAAHVGGIVWKIANDALEAKP